MSVLDFRRIVTSEESMHEPSIETALEFPPDAKVAVFHSTMLYHYHSPPTRILIYHRDT